MPDRQSISDALDSAQYTRDNVVGNNSTRVGEVSPKSRYSKNITLEDWNQLIANIEAALENAQAQRGYEDAIRDALEDTIDIFMERNPILRGFDEAPTQGSDRLITSGSLYNYLDARDIIYFVPFGVPYWDD